MKKRWMSLLLVLALAISLCSVCVLATDTAEDEAQTQVTDAQTDEQADENPAEADVSTDNDVEDEQDDAREEGEAMDEANEDEQAAAETEDNHLHEVDHLDACVEASFEPLTVTGGVLESGCYYLTQDLALEQPLCVPKNGAQVTLCLNGYTLSLADGAEGCLIYVAISDAQTEGSTLTIIDCNGAQRTSNYYLDESGTLVFDDGSFAWQEAYIAAKEKNALSGGRMTGATAGAISVGDYNTLYLTDVNIIDNTGRYGAGLVIAEHAQAVLEGCVIAGNRLVGEMKDSERQIMGGGVYCAGTLELSGAATITGNHAQEAQNDLWLEQTASLSIGKDGLDEQARIGVSGTAEQQVLHGYSDDFSKNFISNDPTLCISTVQEDGLTELRLQEAVYTLRLELGDDAEQVTLEVQQGQSLRDLQLNDPEREEETFAGWFTADETQIDPEQPLHLTQDTVLYAVWTKQEEPTEDEAETLVYDPDAPLTRTQAVRLLYQMAKQLGLAEQEEQADATLPEALQALDTQTQEAFVWALEAELVTQEACEQPEALLDQQSLQTLLEAFYALPQMD